MEIEAYPEAKVLTVGQLQELCMQKGGLSEAAETIGASEAFVRQNIRPNQYANRKKLSKKPIAVSKVSPKHDPLDKQYR